MRNAMYLSLCLGLCTALPAPPAWSELPAPAPALAVPRTETGELQGAPWRIDIPAHWNGELVMVAHGFEPVGTARPVPWPANPWSDALVKAGYAVAQSGYGSQGWAVSEAIDDTERLRQHFVARHPDTRRSWILGFSMGGAVAIATLERLPQHYAGGISLCGANLPGTVLAGEMLTSLLAFEYFFPATKGLPAQGLTSPAAAAIPQAALFEGIATAVQSNPEAAARLARRLEVKPDELAGTVSLHTLVFQQLVTRSGGIPVGNKEIVYAGFGDDKAFNAGVRRLTADTAAQARLERELRLTGALSRPLVLQFNHNDPSVTPRFESVYPALAAKAGATPQPGTLPPTGEGHCDFKPEEVVEAVSRQSRRAREPAQH